MTGFHASAPGVDNIKNSPDPLEVERVLFSIFFLFLSKTEQGLLAGIVGGVGGCGRGRGRGGDVYGPPGGNRPSHYLDTDPVLAALNSDKVVLYMADHSSDAAYSRYLIPDSELAAHLVDLLFPLVLGTDEHKIKSNDDYCEENY